MLRSEAMDAIQLRIDLIVWCFVEAGNNRHHLSQYACVDLRHDNALSCMTSALNLAKEGIEEPSSNIFYFIRLMQLMSTVRIVY